MKILKGILIAVAVLVLIIVIIPAFVDSEYRVERSITVNAPVEKTFMIAKNYEYYVEWNPWSQMEPSAYDEMSGTPGEVGSKWSWEGDTVGVGSLTLVSFEPYSRIESRLEFVSPYQSVARDLWTFEEVDSTTTEVTWAIEGESPSYMMRYMNLGMEGMLGPQFEQGLQNFKQLVESLPDEQQMEQQAEVITK